MGIELDKVSRYWNLRSKKHERDTVGFLGNIGNQESEYIKKQTFVKECIKEKSSLNMFTLDYGSGVGRWSPVFENYLGVEICEKLYKYAKEDFPNHSFFLERKPFFFSNELNKMISSEKNKKRFFTSTVLQHNTDKSVNLFFKNVLAKSCFDEFVFYECSEKENRAAHMAGRSPKDYLNTVSYTHLRAHET